MVEIVAERGGEYFNILPDGCICRRTGYMKAEPPSGQWRIVGAVERNNFGNVTRRYTLAEILADPDAIPWRWKNGAQRVFLRDFDHGTIREWGSPRHSVKRVGGAA